MITLSQMIAPHRLLDLETTEHLPALEIMIKSALPRASSSLQFHALEEIRSHSSSKEINLGKGFALSHARLDAITEIEAVVGLFRQPTGYLEGEPVHSVFCILIPSDQSHTYLSLMARLSRFLLQDGIDDIFLGGDHAAIVTAVQSFETE
ncbi:PTS sugar transporter subunit IIA [Spirochaeta africana]|uniref:Phosphotransferase system mannitol/fructose-specifc IIA component (Ntr-type) n=1 Tax=Spirochaeta africana (strain ATCC 700263 / DSM 8902 / Z-7692) TaxID=889378 RepID=H9UHC6_SPIAZ|nr:PTS sugar transporter subunit IIA [Spirochaeta africana]AFG36919.1 phosphotransferase system mannitol/fructose-specifc IIA component (Ntr-type) [Spirochaeta africana DSM 8902]